MDFTLITLAAVVIILALDVWAIVSVMRSTKTSATKIGWAIVIVVMPLAGLAIWGIAGPPRCGHCAHFIRTQQRLTLPGWSQL